jgi:hypothetical protein
VVSAAAQAAVDINIIPTKLIRNMLMDPGRACLVCSGPHTPVMRWLADPYVCGPVKCFFLGAFLVLLLLQPVTMLLLYSPAVVTPQSLQTLRCCSSRAL